MNNNNPDPRHEVPLNELFRETYDLVEEAVDATTDRQIDDQLRNVLSLAGYNETAVHVELRPHTDTDPDGELDDSSRGRQLLHRVADLVYEPHLDAERAQRLLDLELAERTI